ncbi:LytTR family DNA-binding domain-containing protein [Clostridium sp. MB40-C1]|uniref:LytR/AlgR family response regulator transcription factor n=1 Tax=Clostridium sp. MB40-C1 TaxID=3070996 RepID=UPI0027DF0A9B|nr:LytTR family DNA-binding domain-containing protein [Clostridium sp. MB40-C1]WMJ79422.1 LytTR family DNA-binding domain-containing protein [Clostridium sp. MB40-C1]
MKTILLVEDDIKQRRNLKIMLKETNDNLKIYEAHDKDEALKIANKVFINLFFIDVFLESSSGLDLALELRKISNYKFSWIVFLTTHVQYMIQAFKEVHCYDYILKPYKKEDVIKLTKKLLSATYMVNAPADGKKYVVFEIRKGFSVKIYIDQIIFIEVNLSICTIHTKQGKYKIKRLSLKKALKLIDCQDIIQCHKSFAVNINYIKKIESISIKLNSISFDNYDEKALLGYKFKNILEEKFK